MPRRRMIHPDIWSSEDFSSLSMLSKLVFIGMFSLADDEGKGRANPAYLKSAIFPYDDKMRVADIDKTLSEIGSKMSVTLYVHNEKDYYRLESWEKWQRVEKPQPSKIPNPEAFKANSNSGSIPKTFQENSGIIPEPFQASSGIIPKTFQTNSGLSKRKLNEDEAKQSKEKKDTPKANPAASATKCTPASATKCTPVSPASQFTKAQIASIFDDIWYHYPNKKGKTDAFKHFTKAVESGVPTDTIADGVRNYAFYVQQKNVEQQYIKHGSTWFNQRCWEDDYTVTLQQKDESTGNLALDMLRSGVFAHD